MDGSAAAARLIIVCGLPGSGKTTLAKALETQHRQPSLINRQAHPHRACKKS